MIVGPARLVSSRWMVSSEERIGRRAATPVIGIRFLATSKRPFTRPGKLSSRLDKPQPHIDRPTLSDARKAKN